MQFRDLKAQYQHLKRDIDEGIQAVINDANFISGVQIEELEQQLAKYIGVKHCITCANGTDALNMVLMAWGIKEGDVVFVPDFTFFASGEVVSFRGATPVFVDVDENTFNIKAERLEEAIIKVLDEGIFVPKVIISVDLFGLPADYKSLRLIASKYNLRILEDGAQGFGGEIGNKRACSFGDISTTSFFPAKPLGCYGDGGAIFLNDDETAKHIKSIRAHGKGETKYDNIIIGCNSRLDTLQASILLTKLKAFVNDELTAVNMIAQKYTKSLSNYVKTPVVPEGFLSSWAQYTIQLTSELERDELKQYLNTYGIPSMIYYPKPMHQQIAFNGVKVYQSFNISEKLCKTVLSLPMHPYLLNDEIDFICGKIIDFKCR